MMTNESSAFFLRVFPGGAKLLGHMIYAWQGNDFTKQRVFESAALEKSSK
jgi:hypothetical protein